MACRGTEEWKKNVGQGVSRALKGKPKSQEHREKIRQALLANAPWKGKKLSEEHRKKISEGGKSKKRTEDTRRKISEANRKRFTDEKERLRLGEAIRQSWTEERLEKQSKLVAGENNPAKLPYVRKKISQARREWCKKNKHKLSEQSKRYFERLSPEERIEKLERWILAGQAASRKTTAGTSIERAVWEILDALGVGYETQKRIGPYFVDIYVPSKNLVIECDGEWWHSCPEQIKRDRVRDAYLKKRGYQVLRLPERVIRGGEASQVLEDILFGGVLDG